MHLGLVIFPTDQTIDPVELAREAEARGFESLWFPEHSHIPTSRETPWGGNPSAPPLPEFYWRTHDPFVSLAACAAVTSKIKLATGICLVAQRDPIHTAKEVASLDRLSGGRFLFGVGYGWNKEEMAHHGTRYSERREMLREIRARDEGALEQRRGVVRRRVLPVLVELGVAEAHAGGRPAGHPRRQCRPEDRCAHRGVLRWLDADRRSPPAREVGS